MSAPAKRDVRVDVAPEIVDAVRTLPLRREVSHCGLTFSVSSFDLYATCLTCGTRIKVRAYSAIPEIEDVFDAVFEWMNQPGAERLVQERRRALADDN
mgnify:CR=1 FL=1